jgi:hypothetical protein
MACVLVVPAADLLLVMPVVVVAIVVAGLLVNFIVPFAMPVAVILRWRGPARNKENSKQGNEYRS